jgi:hypothetical protein
MRYPQPTFLTGREKKLNLSASKNHGPLDFIFDNTNKIEVKEKDHEY